MRRKTYAGSHVVLSIWAANPEISYTCLQ